MGVGLYLKRKGILDFVELAKMLPEYIECLKKILQNLNSNIYNICQNI